MRADQKDLQVFESVARNHPALRDYLQRNLDEQVERLIQIADGEQLRVTQGHARCLQNLIELLDHHRSPRAKAHQP